MKIQFKQIKNRYKLFIISSLCNLIFTGCSKSEFSGTLKDAVYVAGNTSNSNTVFWRNDSLTILPDASFPGKGPTIFVDSSDIYLSRGCYYSPTSTVARYWKNGISHDLTSGVGVLANSNSIFVKNNNVYIAGDIDTPDMLSRACYWINGIIYYLTNGASNASAESIFVYNDDVYVAGYEFEQIDASYPIYKYATYWKNGKAVRLNESTLGEILVNSIFVSNGDVYVGGSIDGYAVYWKNGKEVKLTDGASNATVNSVFVYSDDVYAAGLTRDGLGGQVPTYWKNGTPVYLTGQRYSSGVAHSISVTASGVYVAGVVMTTLNYTAIYWKNGVPVFLADPSKGSSGAYSIYVKSEKQ